MDMQRAAIRLDPAEFVNLRKIEFRAVQKAHPFAAQLKLVDANPEMRDVSGKPTLFGFLLEEGSPPSCSTFDDPPNEATTPLCGTRAVQSPDFQHVYPSPPHASDRCLSRTESAPAIPSNKDASADRYALPTSTLPEAGDDDDGPIDLTSISRSRSAAGNFSVPGSKNRRAPRLSSHLPTQAPFSDEGETLDESSTVALPDFILSDARVFPVGSFEVVLVLDTREVESKTGAGRDKISEALELKGVRVETRPLKLGDVCWIARKLDGFGSEEDECVLDYVIERKRLDDLCSSIRDGRYTEQSVSSPCPGFVNYTNRS